MFQKILVVCVGNICRSPMAEAVLNGRLQNRGQHTVQSAGIGALVNAPADPIAVDLMKQRGMDISSHIARQLTAELGRQFDLILVMERLQKEWIEKHIFELRGRVYTLGHWTNVDIPDPYRQPREQFQHCLTLIDQGVLHWEKKL